MSEGQAKKLYILWTLEILKKYSDVDHHLKQNDIIRYMEKDYGVDCERKAVARNISKLKEMGYEIVKDNGYYLEYREFEDSELRLLVDSVLASRHIPSTQAKQLIEKLVNQSSVYFKKQVRHISNLDRMNHVKTAELFYNIEILSEAIDKKCKVSFFYCKKDKNLESKPTSKRPHIVNPYQIVVANGKYYLIGNVDKYDNVTHFRVERISKIKLVEEPRKDEKKVSELKNGLNLPEHMMEHIYMFSGESDNILLKVKEERIDDVLDWIGDNVTIRDAEEKEYVYVRFKANHSAMKYWAIQFGEVVEVIEPAHLREEVANTLDTIMKKYK